MSTKTATPGATNLRCYDSSSGNASARDVISNTYASPEDCALHAEAKRRVQRTTPSLTDEQWASWLAEVAARGGRVTLTLDAAVALYDIERSSAVNVARAMGQIE